MPYRNSDSIVNRREFISTGLMKYPATPIPLARGHTGDPLKIKGTLSVLICLAVLLDFKRARCIKRPKRTACRSLTSCGKMSAFIYSCHRETFRPIAASLFPKARSLAYFHSSHFTFFSISKSMAMKTTEIVVQKISKSIIKSRSLITFLIIHLPLPCSQGHWPIVNSDRYCKML